MPESDVAAVLRRQADRIRNLIPGETNPDFRPWMSFVAAQFETMAIELLKPPPGVTLADVPPYPLGDHGPGTDSRNPEVHVRTAHYETTRPVLHIERSPSAAEAQDWPSITISASRLEAAAKAAYDTMAAAEQRVGDLGSPYRPPWEHLDERDRQNWRIATGQALRAALERDHA
jgi:hypothetical protein